MQGPDLWAIVKDCQNVVQKWNHSGDDKLITTRRSKKGKNLVRKALNLEHCQDMGGEGSGKREIEQSTMLRNKWRRRSTEWGKLRNSEAVVLETMREMEEYEIRWMRGLLLNSKEKGRQITIKCLETLFNVYLLTASCVCVCMRVCICVCMCVVMCVCVCVCVCACV